MTYMIRRLEKLYAAALLVVFAGIVFHAPLTVYLGTLLPDYALLIKSWKEIVFLLVIPLAVYLVTAHKLWGEFSRDWIFRLLIAYAALHIICMWVFFNGAQPVMAGLAIDLRYVLFFGLVYTLLRIAPQYKQLVINVAVAGAVVVLGFATAQVFLPADILSHIGYGDKTIQPYLTVDKNPDYIRVNSTLRGPNPLGMYAAAALALILAFVLLQGRRLKSGVSRWGVIALAVVSSVALWMSYSRSSFIAAAVAIGIVVGVVGIKKITLKARLITLAAAVVFVVGIGIVAQQSHFISNVVFHENPEGGSAVSSNDGHAESLAVGTERMLAQPFGAGIGSTGSASLLGSDSIIIENQYLFIAHEVGWLGLALYLGIFALLLWRLWGRRKTWLGLGMFASGVGLALIAIIQPVWVDDTVSIVWWGLAAAALIGERNHDRQSSKQKAA